MEKLVNIFDTFYSANDIKKYVDKLCDNGIDTEPIYKCVEYDILYAAFLYVYEYGSIGDKNIDGVRTCISYMLDSVEDEDNIEQRNKFDSFIDTLPEEDLARVIYLNAKKHVSNKTFTSICISALGKI